MSPSILHLAVAVIIAAQWSHLAVRQRCNRRIVVRTAPEPQVVGLAASFMGGAMVWLAAMVNGRFAGDGIAWTALACAIAGATLRVIAIETVGKGFSWGSAAPDVLVTSGIYRFVKHPLIVGYVLEVLALAMFGEAPVLSGAVAALAIASAAAQIRKEERVLAARFGMSWEAYAKGKVL